LKEGNPKPRGNNSGNPVYKLPGNPGGIPVEILEFQWKSGNSSGNPGILVEILAFR